MTGRELIDSMTNAELADFVCNTCFCDLICPDGEYKPGFCAAGCTKRMVLWLEKEMHK